MAIQTAKDIFENGAAGTQQPVTVEGNPDIEEMLNRPYNVEAGAAALSGDLGWESSVRQDWEEAAPVGNNLGWDEASAVPSEGEDKARGERARANLPKTLKLPYLDTGIPLNEDIAAGLVTTGYAMTSIYRGAKQLLGVDEESMKQEARAIEDLSKDDTTRKAQIAGTIVGSIAEPIGMAIPLAKTKSLVDLAKSGAKVGAFYGFMSYQDNPEDRIKNTLISAGLGAVLTPIGSRAIDSVVSFISKKTSSGSPIRIDDVLESTQDVPVATVKRAAIAVDEINATMIRGETESVKKQVNLLLAGKPLPVPKTQRGQAANDPDIETDLYRAVNDPGYDILDHTQWYIKNLNSLDHIELEKGIVPFAIKNQPSGITYKPPVLTIDQFKGHKSVTGLVDRKSGKIIDGPAFFEAYSKYRENAELRGGTVTIEMPPAVSNIFDNIAAERVAQKQADLEKGFGSLDKPLAVKIKESLDSSELAASWDSVVQGSSVSGESAMAQAFRQAVSSTVKDPKQAGYIETALLSRLAASGVGALTGFAYAGEEGAIAGAMLGAASPTIARAIIKKVGELSKVSTTKYEKELSTQTVMSIEKKMGEYSSKGLDPKLAYEIALDNLKLKHEDVVKFVQEAGQKIRVAPVQANRTEQFLSSDKALFSLQLPQLGEDIITPISTRLRKMSEPIFGRMRKYEFNTLTKTADKIDRASAFTSNLKKVMSKEDYVEVWHGLVNQNFSKVEAVLAKYDNPQISDGFSAVKQILKQTEKELIDAGHKFDSIKDYFPRIVTDKEGLFAAIGATKSKQIEGALYDATAAAKRALTLEEESKVINQHLRGILRKTADMPLLAQAKDREIPVIPKEWLQFYAAPETALNSFFRNSTIDIETRKLLGRNVVLDSAGNINNDHSIGKLLASEIKDGSVDKVQMQHIKDLLLSRIEANHKSAYEGIEAVRSMLNMATLGNPIAALSQTGDVFFAAYSQGVMQATRAIIRKAFGKEILSVKDFGLHDLSVELASTNKFVIAQNKLFSLVGFRGIDRIGKEVTLNAALDKSFSMAQSQEGRVALYNKWGKVFGEAGFNNLIKDLSEKRVTADVKFLMFNELSNLQPITLLEMPKAYINNPNARLAYALKSWTIKQLDVVRRDIFDQIARGNIKEGVGNLARFIALLGMGGLASSTLQDIALGKEVNTENVPDKAIAQLYKNFGASEYLLSKLKKGDVGGVVGDIVFPPAGILKTITQDIFDSDADAKSVQYIPGIGKIYYYWLAGGIEKYNEKRKEESKADQKEILKQLGY